MSYISISNPASQNSPKLDGSRPRGFKPVDPENDGIVLQPKILIARRAESEEKQNLRNPHSEGVLGTLKSNGRDIKPEDDKFAEKKKRRGKKEKEAAPTTFSHTPVILERRQNSTPTASLSEPTATGPPSAARIEPDLDFPEKIAASILKFSKDQQWPKPKLPDSIKMIDEKQKIQIDQIYRTLNDQPGCFIVGVLGRRGVGKSTILSAFTHNPTTFVKSDTSETTGIDMYITNERIVLLDTQPIFSRSVLDKWKRSSDVVIPEPFAKNPDQWLELHAIQMTMFMYSICHVLIVVTDSTSDVELFGFLRKVATLKTEFNNQVPTNIPKSPVRNGPANSRTKIETQNQQVSLSTLDDNEYFPEIVFVVNKASIDDFAPSCIFQFTEKLQNCFSGSRLRTNGSVSMSRYFNHMRNCSTYTNPYSDILSPKNVSLPSKPLEVKEERAEINLFILPRTANRRTSSTITTNRIGISIPDLTIIDELHEPQKWPARFHVLVDILKNQIFEIPRFSVKGTKKWFQISERDWFRSAVKIWEAVKRSEVIMAEAMKERG